jgi:pyruvate dehydrogenase E1 component
MFGFQRIGDLIWLAADSRAKGFLVGGTSGRTTLNGEGLQHEDGHSLLISTTVPSLVSYDPAYAYELAVILQDGLRRMYADGEQIFYYIAVYNENYPQPKLPENGDMRTGILKGMYRLGGTDAGNADQQLRPQLLGSGTILREVERAQKILAEKYQVSTDLWSVTSYSELCREAMSVDRWNRLHPHESPRKSFLEETLGGNEGLFVSSSDNVRLVADQIRQWVPGTYIILGTDGFGRSDTREALRRHFEIDAESITYATLEGLSRKGQFDKARLPGIIQELGIDPDQVNPLTA